MVHLIDYAARLQHAMTLAGKDAHALARELKVSYQAIQKVLKGTSKALSADNNARAAKFLGVDSDWLATGQGSQSRSRQWPFSADLLAACESAGPVMARRAENAARATLGIANLPPVETAAAA